MKKSWQSLQEKLEAENLAYLVVESSANRTYLTGFTGSAGIVLIPKRGKPHLFVDSRYTLQAKGQAPDFIVTQFENFQKDIWEKFVKKNQGKRIGFESEVTYGRLLILRKFSKGVNLIPTKFLVEDIRSIKSPQEIKLIQKALKISDLAFTQTLKIVEPGMTESEISLKLEMAMRGLGAEKNAWEPQIIASGKNSALPHYGHGKTKIQKGTHIQFDFGCVYNGYHTDTSRVVFMGEPNSKQKKIYNLVLEAQKLGISLVKPGLEVGKIDRKVKEFLKAKTDFVYGHGLGHGVGLEIHEQPTLHEKAKGKLHAGQVITIEPGIYIEGWGGMRIEDMVLVTDAGHEVLTKAPKDIQKVTVKC